MGWPPAVISKYTLEVILRNVSFKLVTEDELKYRAQMTGAERVSGNEETPEKERLLVTIGNLLHN